MMFKGSKGAEIRRKFISEDASLRGNLVAKFQDHCPDSARSVEFEDEPREVIELLCGVLAVCLGENDRTFDLEEVNPSASNNDLNHQEASTSQDGKHSEFWRWRHDLKPL